MAYTRGARTGRDRRQLRAVLATDWILPLSPLIVFQSTCRRSCPPVLAPVRPSVRPSVRRPTRPSASARPFARTDPPACPPVLQFSCPPSPIRPSVRPLPQSVHSCARQSAPCRSNASPVRMHSRLPASPRPRPVRPRSSRSSRPPRSLRPLLTAVCWLLEDRVNTALAFTSVGSLLEREPLLAIDAP